MLKFWMGCGVSIVLLSVTWLIGIKHQLGYGTPSSRWVFDAYQHKIAAANALIGPRTLVVAGSNAMFGIDSAQLSNYWQRPAINLSVNAGLGLPYILHLSTTVARRGDIILLPMEYALYLDNGVANSQIIDYVIARDPLYWHGLHLSEKIDLVNGMAPERWFEGLRKIEDKPVTSGTYGAHHLNSVGDQTHSRGEDRQAADIAAVALAATPAKAWHYGMRASKESGGWQLLATYATWAREQGICLVAVPTVLLHHASYENDAIEQDFYATLPQRMQSLGINYVGKPRDFMYQADWFFDTDHHLQDWARQRHTASLIALLNKDPASYCTPPKIYQQSFRKLGF